MADNRDEIYSKSLRAGRRTYFFDVRSTTADDFYLTITESKRDFNEDGTPFYKKHKIYLYKEDFQNFKDHLNELTDYIIKERGEEIISLKDKETTSEEIKTDETEEAEKVEEEKKEESPVDEEPPTEEVKEEATTDFTEVNFEDLGNDEDK
ncbi:MAG: PUR family DNA/RNA-binding protein [Flavobacteriales bacterium]|nr:PUR family DNA/RNA-binding protein [Flavobacteriales bacterium]